MKRSRSEIDREVYEEIRFHIDMRTEANLAAGLNPRAARRDAERRFGNQATVRNAAKRRYKQRQLPPEQQRRRR